MVCLRLTVIVYLPSLIKRRSHENNAKESAKPATNIATTIISPIVIRVSRVNSTKQIGLYNCSALVNVLGASACVLAPPQKLSVTCYDKALSRFGMRNA